MVFVNTRTCHDDVYTVDVHNFAGVHVVYVYVFNLTSLTAILYSCFDINIPCTAQFQLTQKSARKMLHWCVRMSRGQINFVAT